MLHAAGVAKRADIFTCIPVFTHTFHCSTFHFPHYSCKIDTDMHVRAMKYELCHCGNPACEFNALIFVSKMGSAQYRNEW